MTDTLTTDWPELNFTQDTRLAITSATQALSFEQLAKAVQARCDHWRAQGLGAHDLLLLPMAKHADDVINLLAAVRSAGATLLYPQTLSGESRRQVFRQATVHLDNSEQGLLQRLQPAYSRPHGVSEPLLGVLSSGSTGEPKRIWHPVSHFIAHAGASNQLLPLPKQGYSLASLPLNHVGGLGVVFRALVNRSPLLFDAAPDSAATFARHDIQRVSLVPTQLHRLLSETGQTHSGPVPTAQIILGGAPIAEALLGRARAQGWSLHRSYGLSEMASQVITEVSAGQWRCLPDTELRLHNGEIEVRGQSLFLGYGDPWQRQRRLIDGWFRTGDLGAWNGSEFTVIGRLDNRYISGGENVCPEAIERAFINAGLVQQIVALPRQDAEWGTQTVAMVKLADGVTLDQLHSFARAQLLPQERPRHYYRWSSGTGFKVQRAKLIKQVNTDDLDDYS